MEVSVESLQEPSRMKMTEELRRSVMVDNHEAVSLSAVEPNFSADFPEAAVREGADELTLRRGQEGTRRTFMNKRVEDNRWGPPLLDEDWHAICAAIFKGYRR